MLFESLYVYGIVKSGGTVKHGIDLKWENAGLDKKKVYTITEGKLSALVHDCNQRPYFSEDPEQIKELIIAHNKIVDKAMEDFGGVIPLPFNTIIKNREGTEETSEYNLKAWLCNENERLEEVWNKISGKKEYGIRIYYEKDKLIQNVSGEKEIIEIKESQQGKSRGLSYLLQEKVKSKINEISLGRINQFKQRFYDEIREITGDIKVNVSRISINEEKDLLISLSILINEEEITKVKQILEEKTGRDFSFHLAGPFAPYSFVEDETKQ